MSLLQKIFHPQPPKTKIIFIVEDNAAYAMALEKFLKVKFPNIKEVMKFEIGEICLQEMFRNPSVIIMDYFLNTNYNEAETGLETIKKIKAQKPETNIIVLSAQKEFDVVLQSIKQYGCHYVPKGEHAFEKIEQFIKEVW